MKKSITYLPKRKQEDLYILVREILKRLPQTEIIILYGSYARNDYVEYDERIEFGTHTSFMSDYDILVVTSGINDKDAGRKLDQVEDKFMAGKDRDYNTPVQFINDDIVELNKQLSESRYFYTQLKQEGIILYDSGNFKLARRRKLRYDEIQQQAQEYFDDKFIKANEHLRMSELAYSENLYKQSIFNLHQAFENCYYAIRLVFTLKNNKQHNLLKLYLSVRRYSQDLGSVFSLKDTEHKRLFYLLKAAYVESRYNPQFVVTKEDIDAILPKSKLLLNITKYLCEKRIKEYGEMK